MNATFQVTCTGVDGSIRSLQPQITENGDLLTLVIPKALLDGTKTDVVHIQSNLTTAHAGDAGYLFFPANFRYGIVKCSFTERENAEFRSLISSMPVCGFCENENAVFVRVEGMSSDTRFLTECKDNVYQSSPEIVLDGDDPDEDISVIYQKMPFATYSDMARVYRQYQMEHRGCVPLRERAAMRPALKEAADCLELRIRMGWKPRPTPVRHQTLENEPPMKIACDIATLNKIIDRMHERGIEKAEICLVGWGPGGHDGRFPQQYPSDERFGGDEALKAFIARAQKMGYLVVCHTVSCGAYEIANNWDRELLTKKIGADGKPEPYLRREYKKDGLNGGDPWHLCARTAYENYAVKDLPKVREYGFRGMHYIDELTACVPEKCYDEHHPVSRKQAWDYYRKLAQLSTQLFGGYQSEAWVNYMNADVDAVLYTCVQSKLTHQMNPLFDEGIPFWQLVYHGIVMSNASSQTVNYPLKEELQHLKFIEFGGRPLMYFNSKFGENLNWMGNEDLFDQTPEEIEKSVDAIQVAYEEYERLKYLQYEFMEKHEKLSDGVYRVTYSDGTVITVDYHQERYTVEKP